MKAEGITLFWGGEELFVRAKPMLGPTFTKFNLWICSMHSVERGLDTVLYFAVERRSELAFVAGETVADVHAQARAKIATMDVANFWNTCNAKAADIAAKRAAVKSEVDAFIARAKETEVARPKTIPRRRQKIFAKTGGKCFYCACELVIDGRWHIEHKMPVALGGLSIEENLVPACVPCNMKKRDKTADEFIAGQA